MNFYIGEFKYSLDDKGRVNIPAKFRKVGAEDAIGKYVITFDSEDCCLYVYSKDVFETKIVGIIDRLSEANKDHRAYMSMVGENSIETTLDKQGRITIPPSFLHKAKITKEVMIIGAFNKIEIWDPLVREKFKQEFGGPEAKAKLEQKINNDLKNEKQ